MSEISNYTIESSVKFNFSSSNLCNLSYNSFSPEMRDLDTERSKTFMEKRDNSLIFTIKAKDITAFRASVNDLIMFGKIIDDCMEIINQ
jgi:tRNA threonylcarbamoyladenosine modification (KEOPS) complex  Pcc1 subunit